MKALYLLAALPFLAAFSCERHDWEETKALHEEHGGGHGGHAEEGDGHGGGEEAAH